MKITDITAEEFAWERPVPIRNGLHTYATSGLALVRVDTDEGVTGIGVNCIGAPYRAILDDLAPVLIGRDPIAVEALHAELSVPKLRGKGGLATRVISAIDIALWDIRGKVAGMPLHRMLGGYAERIRTYIAGGYYEDGKGLDELAEEMRENVAMGATAVKMKVGAAPMSEDVERVRVAREALGPAVALAVDANCAYRAHEAVVFARRIEDLDIMWFEEPVAADDYAGHRKVAQASSIPVATGENASTLTGFRELIENEAVEIVQPDAVLMGGVTEFMKVAALAQAHGLAIAPHGRQQVHVHLATAIPNGLILEYLRGTHDPMWRDMFTEPLMLNADGTVSPPDAPGLGLEPNYPALEPHRVV